MQPLSPPPPPLPPPPNSTLPEKDSSPFLIHTTKSNQGRSTPLQSFTSKANRLFQPRRPNQTNLLVWCSAILCLIFSLLLILFGIATLIIFLAIKPRYPSFDVLAASLNSVYFDSAEYFNGDFAFLANVSNPNKKLRLRFEYVDVGLYFADKQIATQALQPFILRKGERRLESVHLISSLVYLPQNPAVQLQKQVQSNKVVYLLRATFRVRASLGSIHFRYWLHKRCQLEMTGPPSGVLIGRSCKKE